MTTFVRSVTFGAFSRRIFLQVQHPFIDNLVFSSEDGEKIALAPLPVYRVKVKTERLFRFERLITVVPRLLPVSIAQHGIKCLTAQPSRIGKREGINPHALHPLGDDSIELAFEGHTKLLEPNINQFFQILDSPLYPIANCGNDPSEKVFDFFVNGWQNFF